MTLVDFIVLAIVGVNAFLGFKKGFVDILLTIAGLFGGIVLGARYTPILTQAWIGLSPFSFQTTSIISFFCVWISAFLFVALLSKLINSLLSVIGLGIVNKILGLCLGAIKGGIVCIPIIVFFVYVNPPLIDHSVIISYSQRPILNIVDLFAGIRY